MALKYAFTFYCTPTSAWTKLEIGYIQLKFWSQQPSLCRNEQRQSLKIHQQEILNPVKTETYISLPVWNMKFKCNWDIDLSCVDTQFVQINPKAFKLSYRNNCRGIFAKCIEGSLYIHKSILYSMFLWSLNILDKRTCSGKEGEMGSIWWISFHL